MPRLLWTEIDALLLYSVEIHWLSAPHTVSIPFSMAYLRLPSQGNDKTTPNFVNFNSFYMLDETSTLETAVFACVRLIEINDRNSVVKMNTDNNLIMM